MNRRDLLKFIGLTTCFTPFAQPASAGILSSHNLIKNRVLRIAHITDIHVKPGLRAPKGLAKCFHHIQTLPDKVDLILNGGDAIMDALSRDKSTVTKQWKVWDNVLKNECGIPMENCIGNHDVWGAGEKNDLLYGKKWALDTLSLDRPYRSFDKAGWHFIILD